jgi:transposase InsO family protein
MGWCNSVGIFQRIVNKVLGRHMPEKVAIFVDDGVVKGSVEADQTEVLPGVRRYVYDHVQDVVDVMKTLIQAGLTVSGTKCKFGMEEVEVLGYQCTPQGRTVTKEKADKIKNWPVPTNKTEVRSFVACCAFYRPLIQHFSIIADPLYHLQKKSVPFYWNESQQHSFVELKLRISSYPVIQPPNYSDATRPLILTVDASPIGAGAVLGQENEERVRYVVKYESCLFNSTQRRYAQIKRELYGLYQMVKKLRKYVHGVHFIIETDARSVIGMLKKPDLPNDAASRWVAYLTMFDYEIRHIPGNKNVVADALSRTTLDEQEQSSSEDEAELWNYKIVNLDDDEEIGVNTVNQVSVERSQEKSYYHLLHYLSKGYMAPSATEAERRRVRAQAKKFFIHEELLFKRDKRGMPKRVIALPAEQVRIVSLIHQGHPFAHRGVEATYRLCSNRFYWNGMYETCKEVVKRCDACQRNSRHMEVEELKPFIGSTLFKRIGVDLMKMPRSEDGMEYLAVARDDFSGWVEAKALAQNTGQEVYKFLYEEVICRFGIPGEVIADRGELHSKKVQEAAQKDGIVLHFTTAYHPQTNGMVERGHQELKKGLAKLVGEDVAKWSKYLHAILWADRITTKRTTGRSPYQLVYGQNCVLPFDIEEETWLTIPWKANMSTDELLAARAQQLLVNAWVREEAGVKLDKSRQQNKQYYDDKKNVRKRKLEEGDMVLMRNRRIIKRHDSKLEVKWKGPYKIVDCPARGVYRLAELDGTIMKSNISGHRIKRYFAPIASATN